MHDLQTASMDVNMPVLHKSFTVVQDGVCPDCVTAKDFAAKPLGYYGNCKQHTLRCEDHTLKRAMVENEKRHKHTIQNPSVVRAMERQAAAQHASGNPQIIRYDDEGNVIPEDPSKREAEVVPEADPQDDEDEDDDEALDAADEARYEEQVKVFFKELLDVEDPIVLIKIIKNLMGTHKHTLRVIAGFNDSELTSTILGSLLDPSISKDICQILLK